MFIKRQFQALWLCWKTDLYRIFWITLAGFFAVIFAVVLAIWQLPSIREVITSFFYAIMSTDGLVDDTGAISAVGLALNNLRATFLMIGYGFIPFLFAPIGALGLNAAIIGIVPSLGLDWKVVIAGLAPHGIFEIPAIVFAGAMGFYVCQQLVFRIVRRQRSGVRFGQVAANALRGYLFVVVPLLLIAAPVEAYITPHVMAMFM